MIIRPWMCFALSLVSCLPAAAAGLRAQSLRCEYLANPLGIDEPAPRLTWHVAGDRRGERQTAYRVLVASSAERLARDEGDLWDSGRVESSETVNVPYAGAALASRQACYWKVTPWDRDGKPGAWSESARWEMGLLSPSDWTALWVEAAPVPADIKIVSAVYHTRDHKVEKDVTEVVARLVAEKGRPLVASNEALGGDPAINVRKALTIDYLMDGVKFTTVVAENATIELPMGRIPYLRRSFTAGGRVTRARIYATALGVYDLTLNGKPVGDQLLAPGWTDYPQRLRYQVYDVTKLMAPGSNVLGAVVAPGWFSGHCGLFNAVRFYGETPALLAQLEITYDDGRTERIVSDGSWKSRAGPWLGADLLKGEVFDARAAIPGWDTPAVSDAEWSAVAVREENRSLRADLAEPVRTLAKIPARTVAEPAPERWTFDLRQNMVGVVEIRPAAPAGTVLTIRHAEMLNPDGTIYTENLRGATSTDTYVCRGGVEEVWQPRFTFHGFRYVELTGLKEKPGPDMMTGVVIGSDLPPAGSFECSDSAVNQLQSNIVWGLRGNYLSIPTDCPQRDERMGWMADAQVFLPTAAYNADIAAFTAAWMQEVIGAQRADGAHSDVAPAMKGLNYGTPAWADAGVIVPWVMYRFYDDKRILERSIDSMARWVEWCRAHSTNLIRDKDRGNDYGDWLSIDADTPKDLIGTAYFAHSADLTSRAMAVLGRSEEAAKYRRLFEEVRRAFNAKYVAPDGRIHGDTQCAYVLALRFDLLPPAGRDEALRRLVSDIEGRGGRLSTGFVGVSHLLPVLSDNGRADVAHRLLMQDRFPSWLFSVKHGATTIWERWNGWTPEVGVHPDAGMNSFNHYSLGSCGQWMFGDLAGIGQEPDSAGFERIIIRPRVEGTLEWVNAGYLSVRGGITSRWSRADGHITMVVSIPANTGATVYIPAADAGAVTESGRPLREAEGVTLSRTEGGCAVVTVGSGEYVFEAAAANGR